MMQDELRTKIKEIIINRLNLPVKIDDIDDDAPIFGNEGQGLGLDSVDALEIAVALNAEFGVEVTDEDMHIFASVRTMAEFVEQKASLVLA